MFFRGITPAELMNAQGRARRERTRKWPLERAAHLVTAGISWAQIRYLIQLPVQAWRRFPPEGKAPGKTTAKPESEPAPAPRPPAEETTNRPAVKPFGSLEEDLPRPGEGEEVSIPDHPIRLNPAELWAGGEKVLAHFHLGRSAILPVSIFAGS